MWRMSRTPYELAENGRKSMRYRDAALLFFPIRALDGECTNTWLSTLRRSPCFFHSLIIPVTINDLDIAFCITSYSVPIPSRVFISCFVPYQALLTPITVPSDRDSTLYSQRRIEVVVHFIGFIRRNIELKDNERSPESRKRQ